MSGDRLTRRAAHTRNQEENQELDERHEDFLSLPFLLFPRWAGATPVPLDRSSAYAGKGARSGARLGWVGRSAVGGVTFFLAPSGGAAMPSLRVHRLSVLLLALALALAPRIAEAHQLGISTGEYTRRGASVVGKLAFARAEVASLAAGIDTNLDGHLSAAEVASGRGVLETKVLARIVVRAAGEVCPAKITDAGLLEEDGLVISGRWDCRALDVPIELDLAVLDDLGRGHRHLARGIVGDAHRDKMAARGDARLVLEPEKAAAARVEAPAPAGPSRRFGFFGLGVEHILTGFDHLLFLLGLVLVRSSLRGVLATVTAFTVAHSITLGVATLGWWTPSARFVEPLIALSVAYIGIENLFVKTARHRWRITFPFGLVHGFGFASALRELALSRAEIPGALVTFNLGVEAGQLAVVAVVLPVVSGLRRTAWFERGRGWGVRVVSGAVALAGLVWFVARVAG